MKTKAIITILFGVFLVVAGILVRNRQASQHVPEASLITNTSEEGQANTTASTLSSEAESTVQLPAQHEVNTSSGHTTQRASEAANASQTEFIRYVKSKFSARYFTISDLPPGNPFGSAALKVEYKLKGQQGTFYLQTSWLKQYENNRIPLLNDQELAAVASYQTYEVSPLFKIIGIGGNAMAPKLLFCIPLKNNVYKDFDINTFSGFRKDNLSSNFFYDVEGKVLN